MLRLPLFDELNAATTVLLAGAGGGFDVFSGLPLYFALRAAGKRVVLANLSFSNWGPDPGRRVSDGCVEVTAATAAWASYFPELYLSQWFHERGEDVNVYCNARAGAAPVIRAYRAIADEVRPDTIVLVDGGTDSLLRGDEQDLGTPEEDVASIAAVDALTDVPRRLLVSLGFGIDAFHGVCHAHVLEAVADLIRADGYLGAISLTRDMPEVDLFRQAVDFATSRMPGRESIVLTSILAALDGFYGDHQTTERTAGSRLYINPLMSIYFGFRLAVVARRIVYLDRIRNTETYTGLTAAIGATRASIGFRLPEALPM